MDHVHEAYLRRDHLVGYLPRVLCLEPTNVCDFRCTSCFRPLDPPRFLSVAEVRDWVERNTKAFSQSPVWLHFSGESLLHPQIEDLARALVDRGVEIMLSTHAGRLDEDGCHKVLRMGLSLIVFSLDAARPETYHRIRVGGDFERVEGNVRRFIALRGAAALPVIQAQLVLGDQEIEEVFEFLQRWHEAGADTIHIKRFSTRGGQIVPPPGAVGRLASRPHRLPCLDPWQNVVVRADGSVVPCCADFNGYLKLGDLHSQTLEEIWNGEPAQRLRRAHATGQGLPEICRQCTDYKIRTNDTAGMTETEVLTDMPGNVAALASLLARPPRHLLFDFRRGLAGRTRFGH